MSYVSVNIASLSTRKEQLINTVNSLLPQCDIINICLNNYEENPFKGNPKVNVIFSDNSYGDVGKFIFVNSMKGYYFSCDDDIIYPKDYVETMVKEIDKHQCIISYHGRVLNPEVEGYYAQGHREMRYFQPNTEAYFLDVCGTGVCGFSTAYFNPTTIYRSSYKRMSDLVFSLEAIKQGKKIVTPEKKHNWIKGQEVKSSIFKSENRGKQTRQIELMKQILLCKHS